MESSAQSQPSLAGLRQDETMSQREERAMCRVDVGNEMQRACGMC